MGLGFRVGGIALTWIVACLCTRTWLHSPKRETLRVATPLRAQAACNVKKYI